MAKRLLRKAHEDGQDFQLSLLAWRNTPSEGLSSSPAQRLLGRRTLTTLPINTAQLAERYQDQESEKMKQQKRKQQSYYDRSSKALFKLKTGDVVRIKPQ